MTPAVNAARKAKIQYAVHEYEHDPTVRSYGEEAAIKLGVEAGRVFKTLVADVGAREPVVGVVPVTGQLDLKALAKVCGAKRAVMADPHLVERVTGYVLGGVSPLGQRKRLKTVIDESARAFDTVFVSGGRRGLDLELAPADLARLTGAMFAPLAG